MASVAPMSTPRVGVAGDDHSRAAGQLAGNDQLLLIAAGELPDAGAAAGSLDVVLGDQAVGEGAHRLAHEDRALREGRIPVVAEGGIGLDVDSTGKTGREAIFGDVGDAGSSYRGGRGAGQVAPADLDLAADDWPETGDRLGELALAISGHARDAEDLAVADLEGEIVDHMQAAIADDAEVADGEGGFRAGRGSIDRRRGHLPADHHPGQRAAIDLARRDRADRLATAQDRDAVGNAEHFVQLVRDEDDAVTLGRHGPDRLDQAGGFGWGKDGGRLIEDEDLRAAEEEANDLDPLLLADRELPDIGIGVDIEAEPGREIAHGGRGGIGLEADACAAASR